MKNELKIKGSLSRISKTHILIVFLASFAMCLILRFCQVTKLIDHSTGFFVKDSFITVLFYLILFASSLLMLVMSFLSADIGKLEKGTFKNSKLLGIISILLCLALFMDFCSQFLIAFGGAGAAQTDGLFPTITIGSVIPARFRMLFALLSLIYFGIIAIRIFSRKEILGKSKVLCAIPVGWAIVKLISLFATQISFIRVSDLFLEIVTNSLAIVFLLSYAQCISGVYEKEARWRMIGAGLSFSLVALCTQIPRFIFTVTGKSDFINSEYPVDYAVLVFAVFAAALVWAVFKKQKFQDNLADGFIIKVPEEDDKSFEFSDNIYE